MGRGSKALDGGLVQEIICHCIPFCTVCMFYFVYGSPFKKLEFLVSKIIKISCIYLYYHERKGEK